VLNYLEQETQFGLGESEGSSRNLVYKEAPSVLQVALGEGQASEDVVALMNAWVREARPGGRTNAGYLTLVNVGDKDVVLSGVQSEAFERVEIHEMTKVDGLTRMRALKELLIPAGSHVQLKPGGKHLMLINASERLKTGQVVELKLIFRSGAKQRVRLGVAKR
jgi:copper(I)-binding protein